MKTTMTTRSTNGAPRRRLAISVHLREGAPQMLKAALLASAALGFAGCSVDPRDDAHWARAQSTREEPTAAPAGLDRRYDGETLFRGIYFGAGPVARAMPELGSPKVNAALKPHQDGLIAFIRDNAPGFFARFAEDAQSGNAARLDRALSSASRLLEEGTAQVATVTPSVGRVGDQGFAADQIATFIESEVVSQIVDLDRAFALSVPLNASFQALDPLVRAVAVERLAARLAPA
jgi:SdpC family antimicrobial peptide